MARAITRHGSTRSAVGTGGAIRIGGQASCCVGREPEDRGRVITLAWPQHGRWKAGLIRRVGKLLSLETKSVALPIGVAGGTNQRAVQAVARVELQPRRIGQHIKDAARSRLERPRRLSRSVAGRFAQ